MLPIVAIVGRPNVGKSTLFNKILQRRLAIVEDVPGVTRDRLYAVADWAGYNFTLVDTGGFVWAGDPLAQSVTRQAREAIAESDVVLLMLDAKTGITADDEEIAGLLRKSNKPVVVTVNKVDTFSGGAGDVSEFYRLGLGEPQAISAANGLNVGDILDTLVKHLPQVPEQEDADVISVGIIDRPNVGKSSLLNLLAGSERAVVSPIPGTTRDAVDIDITRNGKQFRFVDTAGLRRKSRISSGVEYYSMLRTIRAVQRCDVCLLMLDANEGLTEQDQRIAGIAHQEGKAVIVVANKWDLVDKDTHTMAKLKKELLSGLQFMDYALVEFTSALTGSRVDKLFPLLEETHSQYRRRITTGLVNDLLNDALVINPPSSRGKKLRIYYMTQVSVAPPTFVLFVSDPEALHFSYIRYLENRLREAFGFQGTPIRFTVRKR